MRTQIQKPESLLKYITEADVIMHPYPHIVVKDVVSKELMDKLMGTFPHIDKVTHGEDKMSNKRFDFTIKDLRNDKEVSPIWREFIEAQAGEAFWDDFIRIFGKSIEQYYPNLIKKYGKLKNIKLGTRYIDSHDKVDLLADAHISINSPVVTKPTSVRASHVDDPKKLYGALFYMRLPEDDSTGGNLQVSKYKNKNAKFFGQGIDDKDVEVVNEVQYANNTFVLFLNTIDSIHGVTPRSVTKYQRQFVNLVAEFKDPLFDISSRQENIWLRRVKTLKNKILRKVSY